MMLPTGTVTFLFTDIEGSTRAWELHPEAMTQALAMHDRLLREAVEEHGGSVFKTVGDAFCCAFTNSPAAVAAAVDAQRALEQALWPAEIGEIRVRMGIHTGQTAQHDGDYSGPTVNRVARLTAIAHGGQIVLSASAASGLSGAQLDGVTLRDLGSHRLKDLKQAEPTFQVVADGLRRDFPALASLDAHPNNLPSQLSSFVGRERELARLHEDIFKHRLVTVAGSGGVGKTRLALQAAAEVVQDFPDGVYFVALAAIGAGKLVTHALASTLGVAELPNESLETTVIRYLGEKRLLLLFDNSEHVSAPTALLVKQIVSACPNVRCIVTAREPLHLVGENVERLAPLSPSDGSRLFLERASAVAEDEVTFSTNDRASVAEICRRLDGIPLAIELAATRLATMPLQRLAEKLNVSILVNKDPTAADRHRTLHDAIEWSYKLLVPAEQRAFMALAVFGGGCTIEALEHVTEAEVDDAVGSLVDKSLAVLHYGGETSPRYRLLEPIAEFASLELTRNGLDGAFRRRHCEFYAALASAAASTDGAAKSANFERLDCELANERAALSWATRNDIERAAAIALDLNGYWRARGSFTEGRAWFGGVLEAAPQLAPQLRARLLAQSAGFAAMQDDYDSATASANASLGLSRELNDQAGIGLALHILAQVSHRQGRLDEAERLYREAYPYLDAAKNFRTRTVCLMNQGMIARQRNDFESATRLLQQAAEDAKTYRYEDVWAEVQVKSAWTTLFAGDPNAAEESFREAFAENLRERNLHGVCQARLGIATAALTASRIETAQSEFATALREAGELQARIFIVDAIYGFGAIRALRGDLVGAAKCCGLAAKLNDEIKCEPRTGLAYAIANERIRAGLTDDERTRATRAGEAMEIEEAVPTS
ncbi:MAG TPA: adenylate/guanylate cyclase domain-containing protein [Candidatus Nitrosotalea sp.]|nr:adenylate/guanylate cyclase domain-containing protein [Candidatus Nitrosotalea sp.]